MCVLAKVDTLSFWKKYQPRAPIMDKINAATLLESFYELVGLPSPPIWLRINHSTQVTEPPPSHTLEYHTCWAPLGVEKATKEQGF
jgi:hypothetical protein